MMHRAQVYIGESTHGRISGLSPAAEEVLATVMQGCGSLTDADLAAGVVQLLNAEGYTLEGPEAQSTASGLR